MALAWKAGKVQAFVGSNPTLSASGQRPGDGQLDFLAGDEDVLAAGFGEGLVGEAAVEGL
jgi:hypothetical protein